MDNAEFYGDARVTPKQNVYYALVSRTLVLGPFLTKEAAETRRNIIRDKEAWHVTPMWQG